MYLNRSFLSLLLALSLLLCLLCASVAAAAPAYPGVISVTEPATGKTIAVRNGGDEYFSFMTDESGDLIELYGGYYYYLRELGAQYVTASRVTGGYVQGASDMEERVKPGGEGFKDKLSTFRAAMEKTSYSMQSGMVGASSIPQIPQDYDINSDGSLDAGKNSIVYLSDGVLENIKVPQKQSTCPLVVLHITYSDLGAAFDDAAWHKRIFDDGVADYYSTVSNGSFTYVPAAESDGTANDGVITVELPIFAPLWARGSADNLNCDKGVMAGVYAGTDGRNYAIYNSSSLFAYGMLKAAQYLGDLTVYDRNSDGYVSPTEMAFVMVVSGYEAAYQGSGAVQNRPAVWAHSGNTNSYLYTPDKSDAFGYDLGVKVGGVQVYKYTQLGEVSTGALSKSGGSYVWNGAKQMQFGTICHELGHDLGLMDLYDTSYSDLSLSVNSLSLMAGGNWGGYPGQEDGISPTHIDAYDKAFLGFYAAQSGDQGRTYTLYASEPEASYNLLRVNTGDPNIYYLLENRRYSGYDRGLSISYFDITGKLGGIVVWRVDQNAVSKYWNTNTLNAHDGEYAIMPVFHNDLPWEPFWGGSYYSMGDTLVLPEGNIPLTFYDVSDQAMQVHIGYVQPGLSDGSGGGDGYSGTCYSFKSAPARNADGSVSATVDADCKAFVSVQVDGKLLERSSYDVSCGSTVITLHKDYVSSLSDGEHMLRVQFTDGRAEIAFSRHPQGALSVETAAAVPATGSAPLGIFLAAMAFLPLLLWLCRRGRSPR